MRIKVFLLLSCLILESQSLSLTMNRDVGQGHCSTMEVPPTSESPESCKAPTEEKHEVAVVTIEDPSSSFFVHFRGDQKKDSAKKYCGKPIISKKATGLDAEGIPIKKVIIKRESPDDVRSPRDTQEDNEYQKQYETSVSGGNNELLANENAINSEEERDYENDNDNIANPDYMVRAISGILGLYRSLRRGLVRLYSMTDSMV